MALETAATIAELNPANPVGASDSPSTLDDHIRLLKTVLQADVVAKDAVQTLTNKTLTSPSISQVVFPAVQVPSADANTLDDYEENTWTPAFTSAGSTFNYTYQQGRYTKVGNRIIFTILVSLAVSGNTLAAGEISINLPVNIGSSPASVVFPCVWHNTTTAMTQVSAFASTGSGSLSLYKSTAATTSSITSALIGTDLNATNGSSIYICGHYEV